MCVVNDDRIVYNASGDSGAWPVAANERADRVINNGSTFDVVVYEHGNSRREVSGWALCIPRGQVVNLAGLRPSVQNEASSHRWMASGHCRNAVKWIRQPGDFSGDFAARSVSVARSQLGVREVSPNRGTQVIDYQMSVSSDAISVGHAWCASFLSWVSLQAKDPTPLRSSLVADWVDSGVRRRNGMSVVSRQEARAGDLVAFKTGGGWQHIGLVSSVTAAGIGVISGNTSAPDKRGEGVFEKPITNWTKLGYEVTFLRNSG